MGARVVGGGGIGAGASLATVAGSSTGGRCGSTVGAAADFWMAGVLTGTGGAVVVGKAVDIAADIDVGTGAVGDVESLGVNTSCAC